MKKIVFYTYFYVQWKKIEIVQYEMLDKFLKTQKFEPKEIKKKWKEFFDVLRDNYIKILFIEHLVYFK